MRHQLARISALALGLVALAACASAVPDVDDLLHSADSGGAKPRLVGSRGPLSARESQAILDRLKREGKASDGLARHMALEEAIADGPLTAGNRVTLLRDGKVTFAAMFDAIAAAKDHIDLEYFTFEDIESDGRRIGDLLIAKCKSGVQVNLIYDSFGSAGTPQALLDRLKQAGVQIVDFNPVNPLAAFEGRSPNARDHRKILVVDGTTAILGGVNMSKVYNEAPHDQGTHTVDTIPDAWSDTDLEIAGPAAAKLQDLFGAAWRQQTGTPLRQGAGPAPTVPGGNQVVRILGSSPAEPVPLHYVTLLSAIRCAESRIWLSYGYFVPPEQALRELRDAARRGVDVRLLLPSVSDSVDALNAGRSHYSDLLEAGVKIYEMRHAVLHSKTAVIDGVWSSVGSSNLDPRSVVLNNEVDAVVLGRATARQLEALFQDDLAQAEAIDAVKWAERPLPERMREVVSRMWGDWL